MKRATLVLAALFVLVTRIEAHSAAARVILQPESEVQPVHAVRIADIARIEAPQQLAVKIGEVTIASGPLPGQRRSVGTNYIKVKLKAVSLGKDIKLVGPDKVDIIGKCIRFSSDELATRAKEFVLEQLPTNGMTYDIIVNRAPTETAVAQGDNVEVRPRLISSAIRPGVGTVVLDVLVDGRTAATTSATVTIKAVADVMVATDVIRQGQALTPSNTSWLQKDITAVQDAIVRAGDEDNQDWIARRTIQPGSIITSQSVESPPIVRRGDSVNLVVKCGNVTLHTTAEVKQDGKTGETIRVLPAVSQNDVRARVVEPGLVEIVR